MGDNTLRQLYDSKGIEPVTTILPLSRERQNSYCGEGPICLRGYPQQLHSTFLVRLYHLPAASSRYSTGHL
jgi:hypothetical protein